MVVWLLSQPGVGTVEVVDINDDMAIIGFELFDQPMSLQVGDTK